MITDKDGNIDFGEWKIPTSWNDISLKQFQEIDKFYSDKSGSTFNAAEVLHILCNKSIDDVNALPIQFVEKIMNKLSFLMEQPQVEPKNHIEIDGETYVIHTEKQLTFGEYVATDSILRSDSHNYAALLAVVCRKEGEVFDSHFEQEVFDDRVKLFEKQPVMNIFSIIAFFLRLWAVTEEISQVYSKVMEEANQLVQNIESSQRLGRLQKLFMNWRMRKLKKLLK